MRISISSISKGTLAALVLGVLNLSPAQASILDVSATISSGGLHAFPTDTASVIIQGETTTNVGARASMLQANWNNSSAYLTGTAAAPTGWAIQYLNTSNNSWGSIPSDRTLVGGIRATGNLNTNGLDGDGSQLLFGNATKVPEVAASNLTLNGGGDGWDVFFDEGYTKIFNVYHHSSPASIDCHLLAGGAQCSGFPIALPNSLGTNDRSTGVVVGSKIYVPAGYGSNPGGGLACFNTSGSTCSTPFIQLTNLTGTGNYNNILNVARAGNQVFTSNGRDGKLLCYDTDSQTACAGMPTNGFDIGLSSVASFPSNILVYNGKVYVSDGSGNVGCFDTGTNDKCANWSTVWHSSTTYSLFLLPNAAGSIIGLCLFNNISNGSSVDCVDPLLKTTVTSSLATSLISALNAVPAFNNGGNLGGYNNTPPTVGSRIYWTDVNYLSNSGKIGCWDASLAAGAGAPCPNFTGGGGSVITFANYTVKVDPVTPTCIWINNNDAQIRQFDTVSGSTGCASGGAKVRYTSAEVVPKVTCLEADRITRWKTFRIETVTGGTFTSAELTILNSQGQVISGWDKVSFTGNTLDLSSLTISQTGTTPQFNLTLLGGTATNITQVIAGAVYVAPAGQLCFQVVAKGGCPDMTSFGTGVAGVTDPALRLESITVEAVDSNTVTGSLSIFRYATGCLATINGQTTDFESSTALANAPVQIKDASGNTSYVTVQTDVSGNYVVNNLKPGAYTVFFGSVTGKTVKSANNVSANIDSVTAATINGSYMIYVAPKAADVPPPPQTNSISGMTPNVGPTSGGTVVTITGDFHSPVLNLEVDGVRLSPSQWQQTPTSIIITMPKHPIGPVMIQIYNGQSPLLAPRSFTYVETPGATPSPTATPKASPTPRPSRTPRPVVKPTPTSTPKPTPSASASATTSSPSSSAGATVSPSASPSPTKLVAGTQSCMALGTVYFDTDSWVLKSSTLESLSDVADLIRATGSKKACIVGFTDSRASIEYNLWLSKHRVDAVYAQMKSLLPGLAIQRDFKGKANPAAVNDSPEKGMAKNRRVEIGILK